MPHFDEDGKQTWLCQVCCNIYNTDIRPEWITIPGRKYAGNVCPDCLKKIKEGGK